MRVNKYRAMKYLTKEWIYGSIVEYSTNGIKSYEIVPSYASALYGIKIIPETVGQFTGLHDKNGVEIYDGDIVKSNKSKYTRFNKNGIYEIYFNEFLCHCALVDSSVEWNNKNGAYDNYSLTGAKTKDFEVIGNIHERSEDNAM